MSEYTLEDGRKASKTEINTDPMTKVTEVYVEPKPQKKLSQRTTEKLCVCERVIETLDEVTGEVVSREVQKLCEGGFSSSGDESPVRKKVEEKIRKSMNLGNYIFVAVIAVQLAALAYVLFYM